MAKLCMKERDKSRRHKAENALARRTALVEKVKDRSLPMEDRLMAVRKLSEMPRNSAKVRIRNRCALTGRSRGVYRKFGLSRIKLRELASAGQLPGVVKSSW
ncbi:MAG: 30S ribosomal protein S14 [Alphaproteobacteria bacterium]